MLKLHLKISHVAVIATLLFFGACSTKKQITRSVIQPVAIEPLQPKLFDTIYHSYQPPQYISYSVIPKAVNPKDYYEEAFKELEAMLQGSITPNFERAVFVSENPYNNNKYTYERFQRNIDFYLYFIKQLIAANDKSDSIDFNVKVGANGRFKMADIRHLPDEKKSLYKKTVANWAIFTYITDTTNFYSIPHYPFTYATHDPFGKKDWSNSQLIHLLNSEEQKGNCYTFTALFKILADRLKSDARLCTAPQHIYIQHRDKKGDYYNVELATAGHPGDGTIQTLTHTTTEGIMSGIALRSYDERQSIGLCLVNLAKSYEHKFNTKDDDFMLRCAELVLQYDSLNLNALLLKQQILDERVTNFATANNLNDISKLKANSEISKTVFALEKHLELLYRLGYRQMPFDMQKIIMTGVYPENFEDKNPSPFTSFVPPDEHRRHFHALYGGLFVEVFVTREFEPYGHFTFKTANNSIAVIDTTAQTGFLIDPVAFAYDFGARFYDARLGIFTSVDPLARKFPQWSPYSAFANNPILLIDKDGKEPIKPQAGTSKGFINTINSTGTKLGVKTGAEAHNAMLALGKTEWTLDNPRPMPANTGRVNTFDDKYIYTEKGGWIDMAHFMFYAGKAYQYKTDGKENPVGEAVQDGFHQEMSDRVFAPHSAYSYEDLPSDKFGAEFGAKHFDPNSKQTFGEQLGNYLNNVLKATDPKNAPNYDKLPDAEPTDKPSRTNHTTTPVYTKEKP